MRLLHTSDWHLGKMLSGRSMLEDQIHFIDNIFFPAVEQYSPDAIILSGDIFDRAIPPVAALELFDDILTRIAGMNIPFSAITGNHDGAKRLSLGSRLMKSAGIHIFTSPEDCLTPLRIEGADGCAVMIHNLPYFDLSQAREFIGSDSGDYQELFSLILDRIDTSDNSAVHILSAHCTVLGSASCESESSTAIGGSTEVSSRIFSKFDAVLLGHLHSPQKPGRNVSYSGSPLRYSFDSNERDKSMQLVDISSDEIKITPVPITPMREMRVISGLFDELMEGTPSEDYIYAQLLDQSLIFEPMSRLRERYPNILGLGYVGSNIIGSMGAERAELTRKLRSRSLDDAEVLDAFLRQMCADTPNEDDIRLFLELCRQAEDCEVNDSAP